MKIGLIARADLTGLAIQTWCFWRNMKPDKTLVVDLSYCSGKSPNLGLYPGAEIWKSKTYPNRYIEKDDRIDSFLEGLDLVFTCETPYNYWLFQRARERNVRTVLQYNYEFFEYFTDPTLPQPDLFAAPSEWLRSEVARVVGKDNIISLPVPVDSELLERSGAKRKRTELNKILHIVGNPAMENRNGTDILIEAMQYVKSPVKVQVRAQRRFPLGKIKDRRIRTSFRPTNNFWDLYDSETDLHVLPRRFGGLCLPINESLGLGIPVTVTQCPPNSSWLPSEMLVRSEKTRKIQTRAPIWIHEINPFRLAAHIDRLYQRPELIEQGSEWALDWAEKNSWDTMREQYEAAFNALG